MKLKTLFYLMLITLGTSLIPAVHAQTLSVIHPFTAAEVGGPIAGVTIRGNALYGITDPVVVYAVLTASYSLAVEGHNFRNSADFLFFYSVL